MPILQLLVNSLCWALINPTYTDDILYYKCRSKRVASFFSWINERVAMDT